MGRSTFISAALHVAILLFVLVSLPSSSSMSPLVAVPVDLATQADVTKLKAGMEDAKDEASLATPLKEKKQAAVKEKSAKSDDTPVKPEPNEAEQPKAETKKEEPKKEAAKQEAKKEEAKKAEPKPKEKQAEKPKPKPKEAAKKKSDFDTDKIAALLNKIPDASNEPTPNALAEETKPVRGQASGIELSMSVNEIDALRSRIAQCWSPPPGGLGAEAFVVKVRLKLNEDGTLVGYPTVANHGSSPFFQAAADSAVRAVYQCQPYALPPEKYALWRDIILNFDPSDMYRSG